MLINLAFKCPSQYGNVSCIVRPFVRRIMLRKHKQTCKNVFTVVFERVRGAVLASNDLKYSLIIFVLSKFSCDIH